MKSDIIAQDNRLTTARYELSLVEKRVFYYIIKEVRKNYSIGRRDLFDNLVLNIKISDLAKDTNLNERETEVKKGLRSLRLREFEWDNGLHEKDEDYEWLVCGFINYATIKKGVAEVEVSKKLMPFLVELSSQFTPYSLTVAMSLKSKWSQRMYELCQKWQGTDGFRMSIKDLRKSFVLEDAYKEYGSLKLKVLDVAKKELKKLYDVGQCDVYFEYSEEKNGRSVETLRFKLFRKNTLNVKTTNDMLLELIPVFRALYNTDKMPKNDVFIKDVLLQLQKYPSLIEPLNTRIREILATGVKDDTARYVRFILNEDILNYTEKPTKPKGGKVSEKEKQPNDAMIDILGLANSKTV
ncbi:Plasmid replication initiation protein [Flavobacterium branchiophilum]|uniref:Plasmid replication initiation protein n=1 Tax=Flavobacterium branchiophilum (strain FL-15) TaxID=1034807 RepID=G2YZP6_FLABF|nr:RepB family plasmid replication initiator protein [Flavobacterium branchiophilum]CCB68155.1 Plasmid replication initiation protein [Flavobacterium branchiophilum FL-15]